MPRFLAGVRLAANLPLGMTVGSRSKKLKDYLE